MTNIFRSWRQERRYQALVTGLQAMSTEELNALWITPKDIPDLARKAAGA